MNRRRFAFVFIALFAVPTSACSTAHKVNAVLDQANATAKSIQQLAQNFNSVLGDLKAKAVTPITAAPVASAKLPAIPASATGGVDTTKPISGKSGSDSQDVEGSGEALPVSVLTTDGADLSGGSDTHLRLQDIGDDNASTFLTWQGTADDGDEGQCYLGWESQGKMWLEIGACGATTAHICSDDGNTVSCSACDGDGNCTSCDDSAPLDQCTVQGVDDAGSTTEDTDAGAPNDDTQGGN